MDTKPYTQSQRYLTREDGRKHYPPTHPEGELLPFSPQVTLQNHQSRFQDEVKKLRDTERLPKASVQRGQGHQAHPQSRPRSGGGREGARLGSTT